MKMLDQVTVLGEDPRTRRFLLPKALVKTGGNVSNPDSLLREKSLQIGLNEPDVATFENSGGKNAFVVLDFGMELHGGARLMASYGGGELTSQCAMVRLTFGESVSEALSGVGEKEATNNHSPRDFTVPLPLLSDLEFGQTGFRFLKLELVSQNVSICVKSALAVFVYRDIPYEGCFCCDDPLLNRIYDTAAYTCHLNLQTLLWDGVKRDRLVWIGDMHPETLTIRSVFGRQKLVEDSLDFVREQTPLPQWMNTIPTYSMWWLLIVWDWYWYTGDSEYLGRQSPYALPLLQQLCGLVNADGSDSLPDYFFDWPTKGTPAARSGVRAILALALEKGSEMCRIFGEQALLQLCREKREALAAACDEPHGSKPAAAFLAMAGKLAPDEASRLLTEDGAHGLSTFLSFYVFDVLGQNGRTADALELMRAYYGGMLDMGATTFWEDFNVDWMEGACPVDREPKAGESDVHGDNGAFCYQGLRHSLCHGWSSGPVPFLAQTVLGIEIAAPGCTQIRFRPHLDGLQWAKGTYPTPFGIITVSHTRQADGSIHTDYRVPQGITVLS